MSSILLRHGPNSAVFSEAAASSNNGGGPSPDHDGGQDEEQAVAVTASATAAAANHNNEGDDDYIPQHVAPSRRLLKIGVCAVLALAIVLGLALGVRNQTSSSSNSGGGGQEETPTDDDDANNSKSKYPDSRFASPTTVLWTSLGQILEQEEAFGAAAASVPLTNDSNDTATAEQEDEVERLRYAHVLDLSNDGTRLVVSHPNFGAPEQPGFVQVYHLNTAAGSESEWQEAGRLTRPDVPVFGRSIALSGNGRRLAVGGGSTSVGGKFNTVETSQVLTFDWDDVTQSWTTHDQPIFPQQSLDETGAGVALDTNGTMLAVGAPHSMGQNAQSGQIRFYQRDAGAVVWQLSADVRGTGLDDSVGDSNFVMSDDATTVAAGHWFKSTNDGGFASGIVWVWRKQPSTNPNDDVPNWSRLGPPIPGPGPSANFGSSMALSADGNVVAIPGKIVDNNSVANVYVYAYTTTSDDDMNGIWKLRGQVISFDNKDLSSASSLGLCLSADGNLLVVSTNDAAAVFQYEAWTVPDAPNDPNGGAWLQVGSFTGNAPFGYDVACSADGHVIAMGISYSAFHNNSATVHVWKAVEQEPTA